MSQSYQSAGRGLKYVFAGEIIAILATLFALAPILRAVLSIVGQVLVMVGLCIAAKDHQGYKTALIIAVISLVVAVITVAMPFMTVLGTILGAVKVFFLCSATADLLSKREEEKLAARGHMVWKLYLGCIAVAILCMALSQVPVLGLIAAVVIAAAAVVMIMAYILYLMFLLRSQSILIR